MGDEPTRERGAVQVSNCDVYLLQVHRKDVREGDESKSGRNGNEKKNPQVTGDVVEFLASHDQQSVKRHS